MTPNPYSKILWQESTSDASNGIDKPTAISSAADNRKWEIVWKNVIILTIFHIAGIYGLYLVLFKAMWSTILAAYIIGYSAGFGITAGAHRLWTHKSYKARLPLQILLIIFNTVCLQGPVINWVRDHRMHHKYSETDADPHNATRGFFFAHIGWLLIRKHPDIKAKGHTIDMRDVMNDPILRFQKKYYAILAPVAGFIIPSYIPTLWGESLFNAFMVCVMYRCLRIWHSTYSVNSVAHMWGTKPYNKNINPVENKFVSYLVLGEGFHNYHHTFPWDWKTAETSGVLFNLTSLFIILMARIGWAYDLRAASPEVIRKYVEKTGDGSHSVWGQNVDNEQNIKLDLFYHIVT